MKKHIILFSILLSFGNHVLAITVDSMRFGEFGKVTIYNPVPSPEAFVIFISGDGGWNLGVIEMATNIAKQGAMVVGVDIRYYFKSIKSQKVKCYYPAGDFEELSLTIQKTYRLVQYIKPVLVGYSSGATLAYGMLAQAPENTFKGAISLGFCPDIETDKTLCNGTGLTTHVLKEGKSYYLEATKKLTAPFIVLQGMIDQVCPYSVTEKYMQGMPLGEIIPLPKVGHGFSVTRNWFPIFISAYKKIVSAPSYKENYRFENNAPETMHSEPGNLPITTITSTGNDTLPMVFFISGDGGWTGFDQSLSQELADKGMPVVGLDAQKYFWEPKTPEETALAILKSVDSHLKLWNKKTFVLVGYSFGADVVPFIANRFPGSIKNILRGVYSLSPDETADFEIHITDMLSLNTTEKYNVIEEMKRIKALNPVCIFGEGEDAELRNHFAESGAKIITLPGNHHYHGDYSAVAASILKDWIR